LPLIKEAFGLYVMPADARATLEKAVTEGKAQDASEEAKRMSKRQKRR